jgi:hypothetical protein
MLLLREAVALLVALAVMEAVLLAVMEGVAVGDREGHTGATESPVLPQSAGQAQAMGAPLPAGQ